MLMKMKRREKKLPEIKNNYNINIKGKTKRIMVVEVK